MSRAQRQPERIKLRDAAAILGVEGKDLRKLAERGLIPNAFVMGRLCTFKEDVLRVFLPEFERSKEALLESLKPQKVDTVYVIRCGYRVKIGFTQNVAQRMRSLKTGNHRPMALLASWPAPQAEEKALHARFSDLRISGEWFALRKPIKEWLRDEHGVMGL
jgi:hypothetical protein